MSEQHVVCGVCHSGFDFNEEVGAGSCVGHGPRCSPYICGQCPKRFFGQAMCGMCWGDLEIVQARYLTIAEYLESLVDRLPKDSVIKGRGVSTGDQQAVEKSEEASG